MVDAVFCLVMGFFAMVFIYLLEETKQILADENGNVIEFIF